MRSDYHLTQGDGNLASDRLDEMANVYVEVYAEPPYDSGPLWRRDAFLDRTRRQIAYPGFAIVLAHSDENELIGYSFGLPFEEGGWWSGDASQPPKEILQASKFAVIELILRKPWRGRGIGREMHDRLLTGRPEQYAILTSMPTAPARLLYQRWGWRQVGTAQHTTDSPTLDALVLPLPVSD